MRKSNRSLLLLICIIAFLNNKIIIAQDSIPIRDWGFIGSGIGYWKIHVSDAKNVTLSSERAMNFRAAIRGGFDSIAVPTGKAIVISGKLEFFGAGFNPYSFRFGIFWHDSAGAIQYSQTDSVRWSGTDKKATGYLFLPPSGSSITTWTNGSGSLGVVRNSIWSSPFDINNLPLAAIKQFPPRVIPSEGKYKFLVSVEPQDDGTKEIRFYLIKEDYPCEYAFLGSAKDTTKISNKFNGVCFLLLNASGGAKDEIDSLRIEEVKVKIDEPIVLPDLHSCLNYYIDQWGFYGGRTGNWNVVPDPDGLPGNFTITGKSPGSGWVAVRGGFEFPVTPTVEDGISVMGKIEFVDGGFETANSFRFGIFNSDSAGTIKLDSALNNNQVWTGTEMHNTGYLFIPPSGTNNLEMWQGKFGSCGAVINDTWFNTNGDNSYVLSTQFQNPGSAIGIAGTYQFAIAVQPKEDGKQEVRAYLINDYNKYFFGPYVIDPSTQQKPNKFNSIIFALNNATGNTTTHMNLYDVEVQKYFHNPGPNVYSYLVDEWGFTRNKYGGWKFKPSEYMGNASISGTIPNKEWVSLRGGFRAAIKLPKTYFPYEEYNSLMIKGKLELSGGDIDTSGSLRFGVFYSESAGSVVSTPIDSTHWSGSDQHHSGYLFVPPSRAGSSVKWNGIKGTCGAIVAGNWTDLDGANCYSLGDAQQFPENTALTSGKYNFAISIQLQPDSSNEIRYYLTKEDNSYQFRGTAKDYHNPLASDKFNSICFALNNNTSVTGLNLTDVEVGIGKRLDSLMVTSVETDNKIQLQYNLNQNYPNPFNPVTVISYQLPKISHVELKVYDILGREVAILVNEEKAAGIYNINFNAGNLPSGVYFYRLRTNNFVQTKKLVLLK